MSGQVDRVRWIPGNCVLTLDDRQAVIGQVRRDQYNLAKAASVRIVDAFLHRMLKS